MPLTGPVSGRKHPQQRCSGRTIQEGPSVRGRPLLVWKSLPHYRNHGRFTIRRNGQIGFTNKVTKKFVGIDKCLIMNNKVNNHIQKLESEVGETTQMSIRVGVNTDSFLIQPKLNNSKINLISFSL